MKSDDPNAKSKKQVEEEIQTMTKAQNHIYEYLNKNSFMYIDDSRRFKAVNALVDLGMVTKEVIIELRSVTLKVRKSN